MPDEVNQQLGLFADGIAEYEANRNIRNTVIDTMPAPSARAPIVGTPADHLSSFFMFAGAYADSMVPFGSAGKARDSQLRKFITEDNIFASALGIVCSRNSGFGWALEGPPRTIAALQDIFDYANLGKGWHDLIVKTSIDLYTQDDGAFWEIVRTRRSESAPVVGINHLDAQRCFHTGNPYWPVAYIDRLSKYHILAWFEVVTFAELPVTSENLYGRQYCALTNILRSAQVDRNINIYDFEKTSGQHNKAIHLVKGITSRQLQDAMDEARSTTDNAGRTRYMSPVVVGTIDPKADVGHDTIDLAGTPEGWDAEVHFKHWINLIAMGFKSDYQDFAPLPGGGLGTGGQSEMLHLKSRGKGPGNFMKLIAHAINTFILPKTARFIWKEQDLQQEKSEAEVKSIRAQERSVRIASGEITRQVARQLANDSGDLPVELLKLMGEQDVMTNVTINDDSSAEYQTTDQAEQVMKGDPAPTEESVAAAAKPATAMGGDSHQSNQQAKRAPSNQPPTPVGPKKPR